MNEISGHIQGKIFTGHTQTFLTRKTLVTHFNPVEIITVTNWETIEGNKKRRPR